ncbi:MAG: GtrA family protein [Acidimicrobiales bacterium]|jgi:putative flippase GtrA
MRQTVTRLWQFSRTPEGLKMIKFTMVSVISALTSLVVLSIVYGALRLWSEVPSVLFANLTAGIPSYLLNRQWVWGKSGRSHLVKEILPFVVISVTGIGFALFTASLAHDYATAHHLHHLVRTALVLFTNIASFGILWVFKFLILNRLFAQLPEVEVATEA